MEVLAPVGRPCADGASLASGAWIYVRPPSRIGRAAPTSRSLQPVGIVHVTHPEQAHPGQDEPARSRPAPDAPAPDAPVPDAPAPDGPAPSQHREVLRLAVPAFLALVAEPLFLLADAAIVGRLGVASLAGLGVASAVLLTSANIFVFLAYGTTAVVARQLGAGSRAGAIAAGIDGTWLAIALGAATAALLAVLAAPVAHVFGASEAAVDQAVTYLRISALGIPAMLVVLATTGVLRGLQDTRTPLVAALGGFSLNIALNVWFVHGLHWGIAGSAWGTVIAQTLMASALVVVLVRYAAKTRVPLRAHPGRVLAAARGGIPLLVRTLALRAVLLVTTWVAAGLGDVPLAAYQVTATIWTFLAFALDALAIAAQAITGKALGAGEVGRTRDATAPHGAVGHRRRCRARRAAAPAPPAARPALHARPRGAGGHRRRPRRRGPGPAAVGVRLRRRRRAHRRRRRPAGSPARCS